MTGAFDGIDVNVLLEAVEAAGLETLTVGQPLWYDLAIDDGG